MAGGDGNPVLLVHGILDTHYMPWWGVLEDHLVSTGVPRDHIYRMDYHAVPGQKVRSIENYAHRIGTEVEWLADYHDCAIDLVAHSMGGLDCRWFVEEQGGHTCVDRLVTLSTPHRGSFPTLLTWVVPAGREMWPRSELLHTLNDDGYPDDVDYCAVWSTCDPVMHPTSTAKLPMRGDMSQHHNVCAGPYGHIEMVWKRQVFNTYRHFLVDGPADGLEDDVVSSDAAGPGNGPVVETPEERPFEVPIEPAEPAEGRSLIESAASVLPWR